MGENTSIEVFILNLLHFQFNYKNSNFFQTIKTTVSKSINIKARAKSVLNGSTEKTVKDVFKFLLTFVLAWHM